MAIVVWEEGHKMGRPHKSLDQAKEIMARAIEAGGQGTELSDLYTKLVSDLVPRDGAALGRWACELLLG